MSSPGDIPTCGDDDDGGDIHCEQKLSGSSNVDIVAESIGSVDISNDNSTDGGNDEGIGGIASGGRGGGGRGTSSGKKKITDPRVLKKLRQWKIMEEDSARNRPTGLGPNGLPTNDVSTANNSRNNSNKQSSSRISSKKKGVNSKAISDEKLFADPPSREDCPICMLPMPHTSGICGVRTVYLPCCGMTLCNGCSIAEDDEMKRGNIKPWCSLCRVPLHRSDGELIKRLEHRMKLNDATAFFKIGVTYRDGGMGLPLDKKKAMELWHRATELGSSGAHYNLAVTYYNGKGGVEKDKKKAFHHWKLAAIGGHEGARHSLGAFEEYNYRNMDRAMKHNIIGARCGNNDSLKKVGEGYKSGHVAKDDYAKTLRAYQVSLDEMKSEQRTKAAAVCEER